MAGFKLVGGFSFVTSWSFEKQNSTMQSFGSKDPWSTCTALKQSRRSLYGSVRGLALLDRVNFTGLVLGCIEAKFGKSILNTSMRWKALVEIYKMHSFALSKICFCLKIANKIPSVCQILLCQIFDRICRFSRRFLSKFHEIL